MPNLTRREALRTASLGLLAATAASSGCASSPPSATSLASTNRSTPPKRSVRFAHLTDIHIQPELNAARGLAACLAHVQAQPDRPELIITGGDLIMDGYDADKPRTQLQWELFTKSFADHCALRTEHCLGNHDIWGWNKSRSNTNGSEQGWGKAWAVELLKLPGRYRSFDLTPQWHVVILDSVQHDPQSPDGYLGLIDDEQWDWLERDLAAVSRSSNPKHTLVVSHIPILSVTPFAHGRGRTDTNDIDIGRGWTHADTRKILDLFAKNPTVKACLSGHMHLLDHVVYNDVTYLCNGAVSGAWWKGSNYDCSEGYALIDLYDNGQVRRTYQPYGWQA